MGGKSKKNKRNNSNKPADVAIDAEDGALDELPESAEGPRAHVDVSADELAAATDKPAKTWLDQQVERMRRAVQHNMLTAQVIRDKTTATAAKLNEKQAESIAKDIEMHTQAARAAIEEFLGRIPEDFEGVTPTRSGNIAGARKGFLKGVKVRIKEDALKGYSQLFSA